MEPQGYGYSRPWEGGGDLMGAASGWERSHCCCPGHFSPSYFADGTLYAVLAGGALAFYVLYSAITGGVAGGGGAADMGANAFFRVRRNSDPAFPSSQVTPDSYLPDWMLRGRTAAVSCSQLSRPYLGLQEFQEAEGPDRWISQISGEHRRPTLSENMFFFLSTKDC